MALSSKHYASPWLWGWSDALDREVVEAPLDMLQAVLKSDPQKVVSLVEQIVAAQDEEPDLAQSIVLVATAGALPSLASVLTADLWWELAQVLFETATEADNLHLDGQEDGREILRQQLLAGELPLTLGYHFPELRPLRALRKPARQSLSEALVELLDGEGLPHASRLPVLLPLWACWTRSRALGENLKRGAWSDDAEIQYQWLVRQAIRLTRAEGGIFLGDEPKGESKNPCTVELTKTALSLVGDFSDGAAAAARISSHAVPADFDFEEDDLPDESVHSEWSGLALLAAGWKKSSPRLAVSYEGDRVSLELETGRETLLAGAWSTETLCNGKPLQFAGDWEELCWHSDEDCDYLELGIDLSEGMKLERQLLLAREDQVLYLADTILPRNAQAKEEKGQRQKIKHTLHLPLGPASSFFPEEETRDGLLMGAKTQAAVFPLALPEWRVDPRVGTLSGGDGRLTLVQEAEGPRLCCPLLIDLKPRRSKKERTWRQLTVVESLEIVAHDVAVGFRIQSGKDLTPAANRTLLGQNLSSEFCAGRFLRTGEVDEFIEIETTK